METSGEGEGECLLIPTPKDFSNGYKERILDLLKGSRFGLTIADLSTKLGTTRHTVAIILAELRGAELIEIRKVGVAKLHILKSGEMAKQLCLASFGEEVVRNGA